MRAPLGRILPIITLVISLLPASCTTTAQELIPGQINEISFSIDEIKPTLYSLFSSEQHPAVLKVYLPENYTREKQYPLILYVPGYHGGPAGNIENAKKICGDQEWIAASLPLFKKSFDSQEFGDGLPIGNEDYETISESYRKMLTRLFELVPNISAEESSMVGFSNGALSVAVLVSHHDEFVLSHFRNFCIVDHGMFHLTDLQKKLSRGGRYLILTGEKADPGREFKISQTRLLKKAWSLIRINLDAYLLKNTGHELNESHMKFIGRWLDKDLSEAELLNSAIVRSIDENPEEGRK